jgi:hypothetical protein
MIRAEPWGVRQLMACDAEQQGFPEITNVVRTALEVLGQQKMMDVLEK